MSVAEISVVRPRSMRRHVDLIAHLVLRQFRLRYSRSVLGWIWSLIQPLTRLAVFTFTFKVILNSSVKDFPEFFFSGLLTWTLFSAGLMSATLSPIAQRELMLKPGFPRAAVPVIAVAVDLLDYVITLPILLIFLAVKGNWPSTALLTLPLLVMLEVAFTVGVGYVLAAANTYVRDVRLVVELTLLLGFYITPVFYDASSVPARYRWLVDVNPVAIMVRTQREVFRGTLPSLGSFLTVGILSLGSLTAGLLVFRVAGPNLGDEL